ncbi:MAG: efflux RND transporter permease subunit [Paracoccaceae bacterium]
MTLPELSVRRPVLPVVAALLILVLGAAAALRLPVREYPDVDPPRVSVTVAYPGAAAEVVERDVTRAIEDELNGIEGVELIDSTSRPGFSSITVEFELDRDLDAAAADVRDRVSSARAELPEEAEDAVIRKAAAEAQAMMWITLTSDTRDRRALTDLAVRRLLDPLSIVDGVSRVILGGARRYAMRVELDRARMQARGVTASDVARALRAENLEAPGGRLETPSREYVVRTETRLPDAQGFRDLVIRDGPGGPVRLGDVAVIELGAETDRSAVRRSGEPSVGLGIVRRSGANTLAVADAVKAELDALDARLPPDVEQAISYDESVFIEGSIRQVVTTLLITVALVIAVVWLSLGSLGATLAPAATIPVSAVGAFAAMLLAGFSINTLTLLALVLAIGLVVDDAVVVLENVARRRERGEPPLAAAVRGGSEVFAPVVATTVVLAAVLLPIAASTGFVGRLFTEFAVTLTAAVVLSSFLALSLGAAVAARAAPASAEGAALPARLFAGALGRTGEGYGRLVGGLVRTPWLAALAAVALGALGWGLMQRLPGGLAPTEDRGVFIVPVTAPEGSSLAATTAVVEGIEALVRPHMGEDGPVEDVIAIIGAGEVGPAQVDEALVIVKLKPWGERETSQQDLVSELTGPIAALPGAEAVPISPASLVPSSFGKPLQAAVTGPGHEEAYAWAGELAAFARETGRMRAVELGYDPTTPRLSIEVDRRLAADLGLSVAEIGETLRLFVGGDDVTEFHRDDETYEVRVRGRLKDRDSPDDVGEIAVRGPSGPVPLASIVRLREEGAAASLRRVDRRPAVVLSAVPAPGEDLASLIETLEEEAETLPSVSGLEWLGLSREFTESQAGVQVAFAMALTVVYLVLAALFSSFVQPLAVMLAVPLVVTGALAALWATGGELNIFSQIGLLLAVGLLAKNAILVVDFANRRRAEGMDLAEATAAGAEARFRPVMMTSVATLLGAVPLALATGPGAEGRSLIGVAVIAGVTGATLITLFIVPGLYRLVSSIVPPPGARSAAVDEQLSESG